MNNKGFMMAEVIVVSAVILVTLVGLYTSYNKIFTVYNQRIDYYDVDTLYKLANIRDNSWYPDTVSNKYVVFGDNIIYYVNKNSVKNKSIYTDGLNQTFKDYLNYLSTFLNFDNLIIGNWSIQNILIMESCVDKNSCRYAYLEVVDDDSVKIEPEKPSSSSSSSLKPSSSKPSSLQPSSSSSSTSTLGTVGLCGSCSANNDCAVGTCSGTCYNSSGGTYRCCVDGSGRQCN